MEQVAPPSLELKSKQELPINKETLDREEIRAIWRDFTKFREEHQDIEMIVDAKVEENLGKLPSETLKQAKLKVMLAIYGAYEADKMRIKRPMFDVEQTTKEGNRAA